jgi:hypothetical protein
MVIASQFVRHGAGQLAAQHPRLPHVAMRQPARPGHQAAVIAILGVSPGSGVRHRAPYQCHAAHSPDRPVAYTTRAAR